ncbi:MAG: transposase [Hyphomicrobiales bacterium]|nr:transposase [Hyphomicrobiales bacterium]
MATYPAAKLTIPLDIPDVDIIGTEVRRNGECYIKVESRKEITRCGICGQEIKCNYGHGQEIRLRHLPVLGYKTYICIRPKRGQCKSCMHEPTTTQTLKWYEQRSPHTTSYDGYLMKQLIGSTVEDVSMKENIGYDAVLGTLKRCVPVEVDWDSITHLGTVGIDEVALKKGHKDFAAIITARQDDGKVVILAVLEDRKKKRCAPF